MNVIELRLITERSWIWSSLAFCRLGVSTVFPESSPWWTIRQVPSNSTTTRPCCASSSLWPTTDLLNYRWTTPMSTHQRSPITPQDQSSHPPPSLCISFAIRCKCGKYCPQGSLSTTAPLCDNRSSWSLRVEKAQFKERHILGNNWSTWVEFNLLERSLIFRFIVGTKIYGCFVCIMRFNNRVALSVNRSGTKVSDNLVCYSAKHCI